MGPATMMHLPGSPAAVLRSSKSLALLCYLVVEPGAHLRDELATLLWSDSPDAAARASLRQALMQLRVAVGDGLRADRDRVELDCEVECDVRQFLQACEQSPCAAARFDVVNFMKNVAIPNAAAYEEWVDRTRIMLERRHVQALRASVRDAMAASRWREAVTHGVRWLEHDPLSDEAVRLVAESELMAGDSEAALARLDAHIERARVEDGRPPSAALIAVKHRLEADPARRPRNTRAGTDATPKFKSRLVGRESQWRVLNDIWHQLSDGSGQAALVEGEVGMGKTRLADEWLRWIRAQGGTVLRGRGHDTAAPVPYGPMVEALRSARDAPGIGGTAPEYLAEVARLLPELRQLYPRLPPAGEATDTAERSRLFEAVAQLLLALAEEKPVVLLIDDVQWCDADTCALLHFLMERLAAAPLAVVLTLRLGDLDRESPAARLFRAMRARAGANVIQVTPLAEAEVRELVAETGALRADDRIARLAAGIHRATDGNPLYVIELLKTLVAGGAIGVDVDTGEWVAWSNGDSGEGPPVPVPAAVRDAIAGRVTRLPTEMRHVVATVALSGTPCSTALLGQVHGISRLHASALVEELVERLLLRETDGEYSCAHPVIAFVACGMVTASRRAEIHRAIAMGLEAITSDAAMGEVAAEIARHAERGKERAMTYYYALLAGEHAAGRGLGTQAASWLTLATRYAEPGEQMAELERYRTRVNALGKGPNGRATRRTSRERTKTHRV